MDKLLRQLEKSIEGGDEAKVAQAAERVLALQPNQQYALQAKTTYLLRQGRFAQALELLNTLGTIDATQSSSADHQGRVAYCFYRLGRLEEALSTVQPLVKISNASPFIANLHAQILYALEKYTETADVYEQLLRTAHLEDLDEIRLNQSAALSFVDAKRCSAVVRQASEPSADLMFNLATSELQQKNYAKSLEYLDSAEKLVEVKVPEAVTASDAPVIANAKSTERSAFDAVAPLWVQRAFVLASQGNEPEAEKLLAKVLHHRPSSQVLHAVAGVNLAAIKRHHDFFESHRRLKQATTPAVLQKFTSSQQLISRYNAALLLLHTDKLGASKSVLDALLQQQPNSELGQLLSVAIKLSEQKKKRAVKVDELLKDLNTSGPSSATKVFTVAQLYLEAGDPSNAARELTKAIANPPQLGLLCTAVDLFVRSNDFAGAIKIASEATKSLPVATAKTFVLWLASYLERTDNAARTVPVIEQLLSTVANKNDSELRAALVAALAPMDLTKAEEQVKLLPSAKETAAAGPSVAVEVLERQMPSRADIERAGYRQDSVDVLRQQKLSKTKKRRLLRRLPKTATVDKEGFVTFSEPRADPERWIAMSRRESMKDMPEKRKRELKRQRADQQQRIRKQKATAAASAAQHAAPPPPAVVPSSS